MTMNWTAHASIVAKCEHEKPNTCTAAILWNRLLNASTQVVVYYNVLAILMTYYIY